MPQKLTGHLDFQLAIAVAGLEHSSVERPGRLARRLRRLFSQDGWLFVKSTILLALIRLGLSVLSLQRLQRLLRRLSAASPGGPRPAEATVIDRSRWSVDRASQYVPGARHCLTRAMAVQVLLARQDRQTELRIGVRTDQAGQLAAHAWLESEGNVVFGETDAGRRRYHVLPSVDRV